LVKKLNNQDIKIDKFDRRAYLETLDLINKHNLNTVCLSADCPNRYHCFADKTATLMIFGDVCTRNCRYCGVKSGQPLAVDKNEPHRIAEVVKTLGLDYVVITQVTRDDLDDGGAGQWVNTVNEIRKLSPECKLELLISDLKGNWSALEKIVDLNPAVINHNIEVVKQLFPEMRPEGDYHRSIDLLRRVKNLNKKIKTKSGLIVGLGETKKQIIQTMQDLKKAGCDILTIGQYLKPSENHADVVKYYQEEEFAKLKKAGYEVGFSAVESGPLVRSSYRAKEIFYNE
jgi:lipoyl synthase